MVDFARKGWMTQSVLNMKESIINANMPFIYCLIW